MSHKEYSTRHHINTILGVAGKCTYAQAKLWAIYEPLVAFYLRSYGTSPNDVDGLVSVVFERVFDGMSKKCPTRFRAWLRTICQREAYRHYNKNKKTNDDVTLTDYQDTSISPDEQLALKEVFARATEIVKGQVSAEHWQVFVSTVLEGMKASDVAVRFGMKAATVRKIKLRVLNTFREEMVQDLQEGESGL